jgi:glutamine cyclotransferase
MIRTFLFLGAMLLASCGDPPAAPKNVQANNSAPKTAVPVYAYDVVKTHPHDPLAFTQGLVFHNGFLYEGTGGKQTEGKNDPFFSSIRKVEIETGKVLQKHDLSGAYFGEGITIHNDKVYQLTWKEKTAFVYGLDDLKPQKEFRYSGEGWGLTDDGSLLYMSDGTHVLRVLDPETFELKRTIVVNDERGQPVMMLNELEWVKGEIWANIWQTGTVVRIDPTSGKLLGRVDLSPMMVEEQKQNSRADVLNGIAYDEAGDRIFVTGKLWRRLFEIKLKDRDIK